jgi:hypothetical protein
MSFLRPCPRLPSQTLVLPIVVDVEERSNPPFAGLLHELVLIIGYELKLPDMPGANRRFPSGESHRLDCFAVGIVHRFVAERYPLAHDRGRAESGQQLVVLGACGGQRVQIDRAGAAGPLIAIVRPVVPFMVRQDEGTYCLLWSAHKPVSCRGQTDRRAERRHENEEGYYVGPSIGGIPRSRAGPTHIIPLN